MMGPLAKDKLKPCPFCGGTAKIVVCDGDGNFEAEAYESNPSPQKGLSFCLYHSMIENPDCPIAHDPAEICGAYLYDTREEAINAWNKRVWKYGY